ncbi:hemin transport system permease protein HmuU [Clostridiales bacterium]|nr:hemin transport system permease protein HmuU [Clostridiales bacterium]
MSETRPELLYKNINSKRVLVLSISLIATICAFLADLCTGSSGMDIFMVLQTLFLGPNGDTVNTLIIWSIRLPMTLTCIFVGASLALAGLQVQTITNNPLASPYTLGISAGASFGAAVSIALGLTIAGVQWIGTAFLAFLFAIGVSLAIFFLGRAKGLNTGTLILIGIIMNFFFTALQQYLQYTSSAEVAQIISNWSFGNLSRSSWASVWSGAVISISGFVIINNLSWKLTALTAGEERAKSLGIDVERLRITTFVICAVLIAGAVGFIGTVAFVGLVAPHCARMLVGEDQRFLTPVTTIFGSLIMLMASIVAKMLSNGSMLPVGIITSIVGVPFLFILLMREGRR